MVISPYATSICRHYNETKIRQAVTKAHLESPLPTATTLTGKEVKGIHIVTPDDTYNDLVQGFTQCLVLRNDVHTTLKATLGQQNAGSDWVFDARPFMRAGRPGEPMRIVGGNDYTFALARAILSRHQFDQGTRDFELLGDVPIKTFVRWISLALTQRFGLTPEAQQTVSVIVAYYYFEMLDPELVSDSDNRVKLAQRLSRLVGVAVPRTLEVSDELEPMRDAQGLTGAIRRITPGLKLNKLAFNDLFLILANSWIGVNARENVGVALEHLPTFITMLYMALADRSYRKTVLARRGETAGRQSEIQQFVTPVGKLLEDSYSTR